MGARFAAALIAALAPLIPFHQSVPKHPVHVAHAAPSALVNLDLPRTLASVSAQFPALTLLPKMLSRKGYTAPIPTPAPVPKPAAVPATSDGWLRANWPTNPAELAAATVWAASPSVMKIKRCESGLRPDAHGHYNGVTYYGLYQENQAFFLDGGGMPGKWGPNMPVWVQDVTAYRNWKARGFEPWQCKP